MPGTKVDLTAAKQNVWLVKVPNYLSLQWQKAAGAGEVGKVRFAEEENQGMAEVSFTLNKEQAMIEGLDNQPFSVPRQHTFSMQPMGGQTLAVFTQSSSDEIALLGKVVQRAECKPKFFEDYLRLKKLQAKKSPKVDRLSLQIENPIISYKPTTCHSHHQEAKKKKKEEGQRRRADKQVVLNMLFSAFEKHQHYSIKELVELTKQSAPYLKKILREIGMYNARGAHKRTWELRPEFSHYGNEKKND